jgi:hypothetical protein
MSADILGEQADELCCLARTAVTSDRTTPARSKYRSVSSPVIARGAAAVPRGSRCWRQLQ